MVLRVCQEVPDTSIVSLEWEINRREKTKCKDVLLVAWHTSITGRKCRHYSPEIMSAVAQMQITPETLSTFHLDPRNVEIFRNLSDQAKALFPVWDQSAVCWPEGANYENNKL
jgi:hypothetical protein